MHAKPEKIRKLEISTAQIHVVREIERSYHVASGMLIFYSYNIIMILY